MRRAAAFALFGFVCSGICWAEERELKFVAIVTRHGVRAPTWDGTRLKQFSAEAWPEWGVAPGELTPHGFALMESMGTYYREWLVSRGLPLKGCADAARVAVLADEGQRTEETGRALAQSILPGCGVVSKTAERALFGGAGGLQPELARKAVEARLGADPVKMLEAHRAALETLQYILTGKRTAPAMELSVAAGGKAVELKGPLATGSTFSENFLLEYANGLQGKDLGWGRLTKENLHQVLELHALYTDLLRRTPDLARARSGVLLEYVARQMEDAAAGRGKGAVSVLAGHDTNLSNLSGMLGLTWKLAGYQPDDTPPGGALLFELSRDRSTGEFSVAARYVAQSLDQMRNGERLTLAAPPESVMVAIPGCGEPCSLRAFGVVARKAIAGR